MREFRQKMSCEKKAQVQEKNCFEQASSKLKWTSTKNKAEAKKSKCGRKNPESERKQQTILCQRHQQIFSTWHKHLAERLVVSTKH